MSNQENTPGDACSFIPPTPEELTAMLPSYRVDRLIAQGGMGAVYAGVQIDLDRPVAIKILPPDAMKDGESIERFRIEARAMARLSHPHIPAVYDFAVIDTVGVLVMELVEGGNVFALLKAGEITPPLALRIFSEVCDAAHFAHSRGVLHGDIKPGNIILAEDGSSKLADFGLARLMAAEVADDDASWVVMGTPEYAAPELYDKNAVPDHRADIYSLGVVLHELLTGAPPSGDFELPAEALGLDPRVDEIIARCMEQDPAARWQSAAEIRQLAQDIIERRNVPAPPAVKTPTRRLVHPRHMPVVVANQRAVAARRGAAGRRPVPKKDSRATVAMLSLAGVGVVAFLLMQSPEKKDATNGDTTPSETPPPTPASTVEKAAAPTEAAHTDTTPEPESPPPAAETPAAPEKPKTPASASTAPSAKPDTVGPQLATLRQSFYSQWEKGPGRTYWQEKQRIGPLYLAALKKLEDKLMSAGDATNLTAVRKEKDRFQAAESGLPEAELSTLESLRALQRTLNTQMEKVENSPAATALREAWLLEIRKVQDAASNSSNDAGVARGNEEFDTVKQAKLSELFPRRNL